MQQNVHSQTVADRREIIFRESLGSVLFGGILYGIGCSFFFLAIANLLFVRPLPLIALLASLAWIAIIVGPLISGCRRTGTRQHLGNVLGNFIRNRFAEFTSADPGQPTLCFGYKYGSRRHYFLKLRANGIKSVDWGPGQGNNPGKDNDWNVALWFDVGSILFDGEGSSLGIYIVGPSGHKAGREAFGSRFIEFLKANQVPLNLPPSGLIGQVAEVVEPLHPLGRIRVGTDEHVARAIERRIEKGSKVVIEEIRGTSIYVRQTSGPNPSIESTRP
ncbi:MAG: NfeD family protein [Verrucomicrobiota bacterium]|jgi:hypothetical protein